MSPFNRLMLFLILALFTISCELPQQDNNSTGDSEWKDISYQGKYGNYRYTKAELPAVSDLFIVQTGSTRGATPITYSASNTSPKVLLYAQGGPSEELKANFDYEDIYEKLTSPSDWAVIKVHQKQTYKTAEFTTREITASEGVKASAWSSAALFKVAKYWKQQGKAVYILSHSYGSFFTPKMLVDWKYENYIEKIIILAGRIQMPSSVYETFIAGNAMGFKGDSNGLFRELTAVSIVNRAATDAYLLSKPSATTLNQSQFFYFTRNSRKLQGGAGQFDFASIYTNNNMNLKKVMFATGKKDQAVGYFNDTEINVARSKANLHTSDDGHSVAKPADITAYVSFLES